MKFINLDLNNETQVIAWLKENYPVETKVISPSTGKHTFIHKMSEFKKTIGFDNSYSVNGIFIIHQGKLTETLPLCDLEPQYLENNYEIY
jgi:hypothetical protein